MGSLGRIPPHVQIPVSVLQAKRLSAEARLVYMQLLLQARTGQGEGVADFQELEDLLGLSRARLENAWNELEDHGLVETLTNEPGSKGYLLVPLDEVDWPLVGAVVRNPRPGAGPAADWARNQVVDPRTPVGLGSGSAVNQRLTTTAKPSWAGVPDRMLTLQQKVQKYQLEKVLAYAYQKIGQDFTPQMADMVVSWAEEESFHFPPAVIKAIIDECIRRGKLHPNYMQKVAENWYKQGIRTAADVAGITRRNNERLRRYRLITRRLNLSRKLTADEMALCDKWAEEWHFSDEMILAACAETVRTSSPSFAYIDAVLQEWRRQGVRTLADVEARRAANAGKRAPDGTEVPATTPRAPLPPGARTQVAAATDERRRPQDYWGAYYRLIGMGEAEPAADEPAFSDPLSEAGGAVEEIEFDPSAAGIDLEADAGTGSDPEGE
ncbi:MAG: DnaD domain protein [Limnochordales bacterium]|nr:DnaD domain protein [Limnochordales bacterium]